MLKWSEAVPIKGTVELRPDPGALDGLGRNHSLETAVADLVDNSLDAGATHILIRFVKRKGKVDSLCVVDNGTGIPMVLMDDAMTIGRSAKTSRGSLGRFGIGLKGASFSQAATLSLMSQTPTGETSGRQWSLTSANTSFECDVIDDRFVDREFRRDWSIPIDSGTIVRWDRVHTFPVTDDQDLIEEYLTKSTTQLSAHLGLVFHRIIDHQQVSIVIDTWDAELDHGGPPVRVEPLNPFGYLNPGRTGYPLELIAGNGKDELVLRCHIWPGRSTTPQFKLIKGAVAHQGLYFYRRDRLLEAGSWDGIRVIDRRLQLARIELDIEDDSLGLFRMNPEKSKVHITQNFTALIENARSRDNGTDLSQYLEDAEETFRTSRKRSFKRKSMIPPGRGFSRQVRSAIEDEVPLREDEQAIDIRWGHIDGDSFIEFDHSQRLIKLNSNYRSVILGNRSGSLNDAPTLKALIYLLGEQVFEGEYFGARDKDNVELWAEILTAAAKSERK